MNLFQFVKELVAVSVCLVAFLFSLLLSVFVCSSFSLVLIRTAHAFSKTVTLKQQERLLLVELCGIEPQTSCVQGRRSPS